MYTNFLGVNVADWQAVGAIATGLSAIFTVLYVILTSRILRADREALILGRIRFDEKNFNIVYLEISNIGKGVAKQVKVTFDPNPRLKTNNTLSDLFGEIPLLAPGECPRTILFNAADDAEITRMFPSGTVLISAQWRDRSSMWRRKHTALLNVRQYFGAGVLGEDSHSKALEEIRDALLLVWEEAQGKRRT